MLEAGASEQQHTFDAAVCDLCGSSEFRDVLRLETGRSLRSDRTIVFEPLAKCACRTCGLVRRATAWDADAQDRVYRREYRGSAPLGHTFFSPSGRIARSDAMADWLLSVGHDVFDGANRGLEYGAGSGELATVLAARCPALRIDALEIGDERPNLGRTSGKRVRDLAECENGVYDLVWAVAVLEHVARPQILLRRLRQLLRPGGHLLLAQPTLDVKSLDLLFVDHLFHFGTPHLRHYARRSGFEELYCTVGHPLMPHYSVHVWRKTRSAAASAIPWTGPAVEAGAGVAARDLRRDLDQLDAQLGESRSAGQRVAVFGLGEVFWMTACYASIGDTPLVCGAVDEPAREEYRSFAFPVITPEDLRRFDVDVVFLTISPESQTWVASRLRALGVEPVSVFPSFVGSHSGYSIPHTQGTLS